LPSISAKNIRGTLFLKVLFRWKICFAAGTNLVDNDTLNGASCSRSAVGLPLGNVISQLFANVYLHQLDFFIKNKLRAQYYGRYCDDFVIVEDDGKNFPYYIRLEE